MKLSRITTMAAGVSLLVWSSEAAAYEDNCEVHTAEQRTIWIAWIERRLYNHDPAQSIKMSKVAAEIINGEDDALNGDIASGLDANAVLKTGEKSVSNMALLTLAAAACQRGIAAQLIAAGASVDGVGDSTPLVTAAGSGATSLGALLIQHGANVEKIDELGHTALEQAVRERRPGTVQLMLSHGSNPNRMVSGGRGTIADLVAHSSEPMDQVIATELRAHGAATALTSTR